MDGDIYIYGDYEYRYNQYGRNWTTNENQGGWGVIFTSSESFYDTTPDEFISYINNKPVNTMCETFMYKTNIFQLSDYEIPSTITNMDAAFKGCYYLKSIPETIPNSVTTLRETYSALWERNNNIPIIPVSAKDVTGILNDVSQMTSMVTLTYAGTKAEYMNIEGITNFSNVKSVGIKIVCSNGDINSRFIYDCDNCRTTFGTYKSQTHMGDRCPFCGNTITVGFELY
jgi:DNA-directed RNA polymerase subunit RPC12/RpoP